MQTRPGQRMTLDLDVAGGMNTRDDPYFLRGAAFSMLRNYRRTDSGLRARKGWAKLHSEAIPNLTIVHQGFGYKMRNGTVVELVAVHNGTNGSIFKMTNGTPTPVTTYDTFDWDEDAELTFCQWRDDCYITSGSTDGCGLNMRYDGAADALFSAGMKAPVGLAVVSGGAGNVDETRYYRCIFVDAVKGYPSAPSDSEEITLATEKASITVPTYSGSGRTIHREVHVSSDDETWKLLILIEDNTTTSAEDDNEDLADLGDIPADRNIANYPWVCKHVIGSQGGQLLWGNDVENNLPARVWRSISADEPEVIDENFVDVGDTGEQITGMRLFGDGAWIQKTGSQHLIPLDVTRSHCVVPGIGGLAARGHVNVEGGIALSSHQGVRFFNGQSSPFVGGDPHGGTSSRAFVLQRTWDALDLTSLHTIFAADFGRVGPRKGVGFFCRSSDDYTYSDQCIYWDYRRNEFAVDDFWGCWAAWEVPVEDSDEVELHGAFYPGFIARMDYGYRDGACVGDAVDLPPESGGTVSATSNTLESDRDDLDTTGDGYKGVQLTIYKGTGKGQHAFIASNTATTFTIEGTFSVTPDTTSKWVLGHRDYRTDIPGIGVGDPGVAFRAIEAQIHLAPPEAEA